MLFAMPKTEGYMAALPYMQLYIADYLADTMHLSTEEHGAYLLLMFNYWQTGKPIPKNRLAKIARLSNERWTSVEQTLNEYFNDNGKEWVHDRIECDLESVRAKQIQRSEAGKSSALKRKGASASRASIGTATTVERPLNKRSTNKERDPDTDPDTDTDLKHTHHARKSHVDNSMPEKTGEKFRMRDSWQPDPGFRQRSETWGRILTGPDPGYTAAELTEFCAYWTAEGVTCAQVQWEQKFSLFLMNSRASAGRRRGNGLVGDFSSMDYEIPNGFNGR